MTTTDQTPDCANDCGRPATYGCKGWCRACYFRWYRAGKPETGPPPPRSGPEWVKFLREEATWLIQAGESVEETARRIGITVDTVLRYTTSPEPAACSALGCDEPATHRQWCQAHKDPRATYLAARADGRTRRAAAARAGVHLSTTYQWEAGRPGVGRPRKRAAA